MWVPGWFSSSAKPKPDGMSHQFNGYKEKDSYPGALLLIIRLRENDCG